MLFYYVDFLNLQYTRAVTRHEIIESSTLILFVNDKTLQFNRNVNQDTVYLFKNISYRP